MSNDTLVKISEAKGRPLLNWVGKKPLDYVKSFPAQKVEVFNPLNEENDAQGLIFHGDNKDVLAWLLANGYRGKVDLIYIDPPFDSGADYIRNVELRGLSKLGKTVGEAHSLGEQIQYTDIWINDEYLQFMYERFLLLRELLSNTGCIYVHVNHEKVHLLRCLLDEVFGVEQFRNDIIWKHGPAKSHPEYFGIIKDTILFYTKGSQYVWNKQYTNISDEYRSSFSKSDERGYYVTQPLHSGKPAKNVPDWKGIKPPGGRGWAYKLTTLDRFENEGLVEWSEEGIPRLKRYLHEIEGAVVQDVWDQILEISPDAVQAFINYLNNEDDSSVTDLWEDISPVMNRSLDHLNYPTQKPEALVERILRASSNKGCIVLDCFVGSGTTAAVAQKLGRRWIAADINKGAIQTTSKRLQTVIQDQIQSQSELKQGRFESEEPLDNPPPAALSFSVYRINDYDLQIQHNEAALLAIEYVGIDQNKSDTFFDGTLGTRLVRIIPFNHPLTLLDLQLVKDEIESRDDQRDIVIVALGKETTVDPWLEEYNKQRPINKIQIIELRTDEKYGKFFVHQPAEAQVSFTRAGDIIRIVIEDFISPTIVERLEIDTPLFKANIPDWRAMVDCVMIDPDYNGEVFNIALSDVPEKKNDLVVGEYEITAPKGKTTVAVKIIDMLGEEVLTTREV